jgi:divalent metal cation (Fe/Co/Zn/Cd) transporter
MGIFILYDSLSDLLRGHHPTIGTVVLFDRQFWAGWLMIPALVYSAIPPMILGHLKQRPAHALHDKTLVADADMNRADWTTALAGIAGILGIGIGWWWADGAAAGIIALNITKDGFTNLKRVVADLMDQRPTTVDGAVSEVPAALEDALRGLDWVRAAEVRLREEGHVFVGEAFLEIAAFAADDVAAHLRRAHDIAQSVDWRVHDIVMTVVPAGTLEQEARDRGE